MLSDLWIKDHNKHVPFEGDDRIVERMFASLASLTRVLCGLNVLRAYAPACPAVS